MDETNRRETREPQAKRKRRSREEFEQLAWEYKQSGLTAAQYAEGKGVHLGTLRRWLTETRGQAAKKSAGTFASVKLSGAKAGSVTLRWPQGMELEIATALEGSEVTGLVRELLRSCLP